MKTVFSLLAALAVLAAAAQASAEIVRVEIHGSVEYNVFIDGPLVNGVVQPGDPAVMAFNLDTNVYIDPPFLPPPSTCHTRGYAFIPGSFSLRIGGVDVAMSNPQPGGATPYFVLRDNDQVVDGVFVTLDPSVCLDSAIGIDLPGASGAPFGVTFLRTFDDGNSPNTVFPSLELMDCQGYWGFEWMSSYLMTVNGGGGEPLGLIYEWFTVTLLSPPVVTQQPNPVQVCPGGSVMFTAEAVNAAFYQWRQNGSDLVDGPDGNGGTIAGANTPVLTITNVQPGHVGNYELVASNGHDANYPYDTATSNTAELSFWPSCTPGDLNCDQVVTAADIPLFISALLNPAGFTGCNPLNADTNLDGNVNGRDVANFSRCVISGGCP